MKVEDVLRMKEGVGEKSYAKNSSLQKTVISKAQPLVHKMVTDLYCETLPQCLTIADLGCSSGPNSLSLISDIINTIDVLRLKLGCPSPDYQVFLNDLPGNDFNTIFKSIPSFYKNLKKGREEDIGLCVVAGVPGSFYGRLFPTKTLHFVHSSYCHHWLSQVPQGIENNKGNVYMAKTSPPNVFKAYSEQFNRDFTAFLRSRSKEIVPGGRMVITMIGRRSVDPWSKECCHFWEVFSQSIRNMVSEGLIKEAKLDSFNLPYYTPHIEELDTIIQSEGSFNHNKVEVFDTDWYNEEDNEVVCDKIKGGKFVANTARAVTESMVASHFGESIVDKLFSKYAENVGEILANERPNNYNLVICMTKN